MKRTAIRLTALALACAAPLLHGASDGPGVRIFDGEPKLIVVNGYSTSFRWPDLLQRKLDRQAGAKGVLVVRKATAPGTPIAKWIDVETGEPLQPWLDTLRPALQQDDGEPVIVLAQQSLQWVFGPQAESIRGDGDAERIGKGADVMQRYVELLQGDGADLVFIAAHIYKKPMEPGIGNERYALDELMRRDLPFVRRGPDVWTPTRELYPTVFARDKVHPNGMGDEVMAQLWFEALLAHDGVGVPEWSRKQLAKAFPAAIRPRRGSDFAMQGTLWGQQLPLLDAAPLGGAPQGGGAPEPTEPWRDGPVLIVTASLTCPVARRMWQQVEDLAVQFDGRVRVVMLYVIEPHPKGDPSPYTGREWVTAENKQDEILVPQPSTLEERQALAQECKERVGVSVPVLVDGMENRSWRALGSGPNMAVFVAADGTVQAKQSWFRSKEMAAKLEQLLAEQP